MRLGLHGTDARQVRVGEGVIGEAANAPVADRHALQRLAIIIDSQRQSMADARIGRHWRARCRQRQVVLVTQRLAFSHEEHSVTGAAARLQALQAAVVGRGAKQAHGSVPGRRRGQGVNIEFVDFLPQHHALARAQCLAPLIDAKAGVERRLGQRALAKRSLYPVA